MIGVARHRRVDRLNSASEVTTVRCYVKSIIIIIIHHHHYFMSISFNNLIIADLYLHRPITSNFATDFFQQQNESLQQLRRESFWSDKKHVSCTRPLADIKLTQLGAVILPSLCVSVRDMHFMLTLYSALREKKFPRRLRLSDLRSFLLLSSYKEKQTKKISAGCSFYYILHYITLQF